MTTTTTFEKSIRYDRQSKDFACYLDGEFVGYAASYSAGEALLDQVAYDQLMDGIALQARCANCDGPHSIQQCPEILAALFAPSCPRCGGRHALADCPQRGPAEPGMLTSQGSLASRCRIEPADDNLEYLGFLDGVLVGIYSTVMTADLALANLAWASDHGLIARVQRCPGAAV